MVKILKTLKINLLSIIALPILLIATVSKLIAKALEKFAVIVGMAFFTLALCAFFEILKNPDSILTIIAFIIVFILLIALIAFIVHFCFAVVVSVWAFIVMIFNTIYEYTYLGYLKLYEICTDDYNTLSDSGKQSYALPCLFYSILKGFSKGIVGFISIALYLSIGFSALLIIGSLVSMNGDVKRVLGINLIEFMSKFDAFSLVYGILMYLAIMATIIVTLLSFGIEWHEWAQELKMSSEEYSTYMHQLRESELQVNQEENNAYKEYIEKLSQHLAQIDPLEKDVDAALNLADNPLLRNAWSEYLRNLTDITGVCNAHDSNVPTHVFKKLIPQINQLDTQRENINKLIARQKEETGNPIKNATFFSGCNTLDKLEKRYKSLCKAYHPDSEGGDEETFKTLQVEYEQLKKYLTGNSAE